MTEARIKKQWSGDHPDSVAIWSLNEDKQGFIDDEGKKVKKSPYFWLSEGQKLTMVVNLKSGFLKWKKG